MHYQPEHNIWKLCDEQLSTKWAENFLQKRPCGLDLWPKEHKIDRGQALTKTTRHVKYETSVINSSQDNEGKPFFTKSDFSDLDFWPINPNNNMGHVTIKTNLHVKYESFVINSSQDNEQKPCEHYYYKWPLTFNLVNPKSKEVKALPIPISMWKMMELCEKYFSR